MRRPLPLASSILAALLIATAAIPVALLVLGHRTPITSAVTNVTASATGVGAAASEDPWYRMKIVGGGRSFTQTNRVLTPPPDIPAATGIMVDVDSGEILWQRNPHQPMPPASTTKELTALVTLANFAPETPVTITAPALNQEPDETKMGLKAGEQLTVRELLYGALLVSANDAATALAVDTVGLARFVGAMNAQVTSLGLHDSHFATPVGLSDPGQYASAYDLAVIAATAYDRSALFRQVVGTHDMDLPATATHQDYPLHNVNALLEKYPAAVGIKPGWTGDAGACLVGMAIRGGHRIIAVLLNGSFPAMTEAKMFDWAYSNDGLPPLLPSPTPSPPVSPSPAPPHR